MIGGLRQREPPVETEKCKICLFGAYIFPESQKPRLQSPGCVIRQLLLIHGLPVVSDNSKQRNNIMNIKIFSIQMIKTRGFLRPVPLLCSATIVLMTFCGCIMQSKPSDSYASWFQTQQDIAKVLNKYNGGPRFKIVAITGRALWLRGRRVRRASRRWRRSGHGRGCRVRQRDGRDDRRCRSGQAGVDVDGADGDFSFEGGERVHFFPEANGIAQFNCAMRRSHGCFSLRTKARPCSWRLSR